MLKIRNLNAFYGKSHILQGVNISINEGEIVTLLGRNGVGRSTLIKSIIGMVNSTGSITFNGKEIIGLPIHQISNLGIGYVSENRDIFPDLTVRENLELGKKNNNSKLKWYVEKIFELFPNLKKRIDVLRRVLSSIFPDLTLRENLELGKKNNNSKHKWDIEELFELFPNLKNRIDVLGGVLSGGEQQMLTICRSLMGCPKLIMIDEPTEGLSPIMVSNVEKLLKKIAEKGISILLVEQKLTIAFNLSKRLYVMGHGKVVFEGTPQEIKNKPIIREWLEVS